GPAGQGKTSGVLPDSWSDQDYAWRYPLGSTDVGSVAIAGQQAFLMSYDAARSSQTLIAIDLNKGATLWKRAYPTGEYHKHARNTFASSTPAVDGDRVY